LGNNVLSDWILQWLCVGTAWQRAVPRNPANEVRTLRTFQHPPPFRVALTALNLRRDDHPASRKNFPVTLRHPASSGLIWLATKYAAPLLYHASPVSGITEVQEKAMAGVWMINNATSTVNS
jgi:hypothetical protein